MGVVSPHSGSSLASLDIPQFVREATGASEVVDMARTMREAIATKGLRLRNEKLEVCANRRADPMRFGNVQRSPQRPAWSFLGPACLPAMPAPPGTWRSWRGEVLRHQDSLADQSGAVEAPASATPHEGAPGLELECRLVVHVGGQSPLLRALSSERPACVCVFFWDTEGWATCQKRSSVLVMARAVTGVQRCVARSACSVLGRVLRGRSAADI